MFPVGKFSALEHLCEYYQVTSDAGYPSIGDNWHGVLATYRCAAMVDARRCQLYRGHLHPHAHAWLERPAPGYARRAGKPYPWHPHLVRWRDDADCWEETCGFQRLWWCCMFSE